MNDKQFTPRRSHHRVIQFTALIMASSLPAVAQDTNAPGRLPDVIVQGTQEPAPTYAATNASTALKGSAPLLEIPQAVSVVPRTLLEDQGVIRLEDALRNVAGVTPGGYYTDWDYYRIRGFDAAFTTYWDGLRGETSQNLEIFGLERIEVVKGPATSLYGQGPIGGLVNIISKRPRPEFFANTFFTAGSWEFYEPALDINGPLNADKTVYGRFNALYRNHESFVDFAEKERLFLAPALTWDISPQTSLTLLGSYTRDWDTLDFPLPAVGTVLPNRNGDIPIHRSISEPGAQQSEEWRAVFGYEFRHQFNEHLALRQNLSGSRVWSDWDDLLYPASLDADQRTLYRYPYSSRGDVDRFGVDTSLEGTFETGEVKHLLIGGVDYYNNRTKYDTKQIDYTDFPGSYPALDLFNPVYGGPLPRYTSFPVYETKNELLGFYVLEQAKFFDRLTLTVGGRMDFTWTDTGTAAHLDNAFTPRAGLTYEFVPGVAAYAGYSQSFNPQWSSTDAAGNPVDPETGENYEVGLKTSLLDGRVNTLLSVYHLTREDVATPNPVTPAPFDSIAAGEQLSRGVELEGQFRILPGWELTAAYTYADTELREDNRPGAEGLPLQGVPEHAFSAWMKYTLQSGPLKGLGAGIGGRYYTEQQGDVTYANPFDLPAYGLLDAALFYQRNQFFARVNFYNILDERYFPGSYNNLYVRPGEPFHVRATVGWSF